MIFLPIILLNFVQNCETKKPSHAVPRLLEIDFVVLIFRQERFNNPEYHRFATHCQNHNRLMCQSDRHLPCQNLLQNIFHRQVSLLVLTPEWSCNPFWSDSIAFNESFIIGIITALTLGWCWCLVQTGPYTSLSELQLPKNLQFRLRPKRKRYRVVLVVVSPAAVDHLWSRSLQIWK